MSKPLVFHPGDWLGDPGLRLVSFEARALWFEMLLLMAFSERRGYLTLNGEAMPPEKLARLVNVDVARVTPLLAELEAERVYSKTVEGVIYNRRMAREATKPVALPAVAADDAPEVEMPKGIPPAPYEQIVAAYHEQLPTLAKVQKMTSARKAMVRARWREAWEGKGREKGWKTVDEGVKHFARFFFFVATNCPFLLGEGAEREGQRPFQADFEWLMRDGNYTKVCEGRYSNAKDAA
jgi:hypothetical protein